MSIIPEKVTNYNVYKENGNRFLGLADEIELPSFENITEEMRGAGIAGSWNSTTPGHFGPMEITLKFRTFTAEIAEIFSKSGERITARAAQQTYNTSTGQIAQRGLKITFQTLPKNIALGKIAIGAPTESSITQEIVYIKIAYDDKEVIEYDKMNFIFKVNGVDMLKQVRDLI